MGVIDLVWFFGVSYLEKQLEVGKEYVIYGWVNVFWDQLSIFYLEMEIVNFEKIKKVVSFVLVYFSIEKLNIKGVDVCN